MTSGRMRRSPLTAVERLLLVEIAVLDHPGELDDAFELQLAPPAADAGALEGVDQPRAFRRAGRWPVVSSDAIPLHELRARLDAAALRVLDFAIHLLERLAHRREQILDGFLAGVDVGRRLGARLAQARFGERQKRLVVRLQRIAPTSPEMPRAASTRRRRTS